MTDPTHLSSSGTQLAQQGVANAFLSALNLFNVAGGSVNLNTIANNGVPPQATINTLANLLATCVNSTGTTAACTNLFANTKSLTGTIPTDTVTAALNIAHNPGANVATLYNLAVPAPPFQPSLTSAPNDWTIAITFYADLMAGPYYPAIDALGNLWVPDYANNTITEFNPLGIPISGYNGFVGNSLNQPFAIAIDSAQSAWVANYAYSGSAVVSHFSLTGSPIRQLPLRHQLHRRRHRLAAKHLGRLQLRRHHHAQLRNRHLPVQHPRHIPRPRHRLRRPRMVHRHQLRHQPPHHAQHRHPLRPDHLQHPPQRPQPVRHRLLRQRLVHQRQKQRHRPRRLQAETSSHPAPATPAEASPTPPSSPSTAPTASGSSTATQTPSPPSITTAPPSPPPPATNPPASWPPTPPSPSSASASATPTASPSTAPATSGSPTSPPTPSPKSSASPPRWSPPSPPPPTASSPRHSQPYNAASQASRQHDWHPRWLPWCHKRPRTTYRPGHLPFRSPSRALARGGPTFAGTGPVDPGALAGTAGVGVGSRNRRLR